MKNHWTDNNHEQIYEQLKNDKMSRFEYLTMCLFMNQDEAKEAIEYCKKVKLEELKKQILSQQPV